MDATGEDKRQEPALDATERERQGVFRRMERHLGQRMIRGLLAIIPLLVTIIIIRYLIAIAEGAMRPMVNILMGAPYMDEIPASRALAWTAVALLTLVFFYLLGFLVSGSGGRRAVSAFLNSILNRIPVVRNIYNVASQATEAISAPREQDFSRVVFLEWPRPGVHAMGLVTGQYYIPEEDRTTLLVYIATIPNPTSGMLAIIPEEDVVETDISVEDAMKIVFSGGIVLPDTMRLGERTAIGRPEPRADDSPRE